MATSNATEKRRLKQRALEPWTNTGDRQVGFVATPFGQSSIFPWTARHVCLPVLPSTCTAPRPGREPVGARRPAVLCRCTLAPGASAGECRMICLANHVLPARTVPKPPASTPQKHAGLPQRVLREGKPLGVASVNLLRAAQTSKPK